MERQSEEQTWNLKCIPTSELVIGVSLSELQRMVVFMGSTVQLLPKIYVANPETPHW